MPPICRIVTSVALSGTIFATGCAHGSSSAEAVLRIGLTTEPATLSPLFAIDDYATLVDRLMSDVLITVDRDGRTLLPRLAAVVPSLANGGISRDGKTLTYHLRHNVKWHDGAPFTSDDIAFSYRAIMNPENNVPNRRGYDEIASVTTPDPYTVVLRLKEPYAPALTTLFSDTNPGGILPAHLLEHEPNLNRVAKKSRRLHDPPPRLRSERRRRDMECKRVVVVIARSRALTLIGALL